MPLLWDVSKDVGFLWDKASALGAVIKERTYWVLYCEFNFFTFEQSKFYITFKPNFYKHVPKSVQDRIYIFIYLYNAHNFYFKIVWPWGPLSSGMLLCFTCQKSEGLITSRRQLTFIWTLRNIWLVTEECILLLLDDGILRQICLLHHIPKLFLKIHFIRVRRSIIYFEASYKSVIILHRC
jgi:hypothetical protein